MNQLVDGLVREKVIHSVEVENAMRAVNRANYVESKAIEYAYEDRPLGIGSGVTSTLLVSYFK